MTLDLLRMIGVLLLAAFLGGLVGWERERRDRPAGLRTHILVCLGSALITLVSIHLSGTRFDPGRIAAQIVSGIGFLGAGTIMRQGNVVRGLTTAASLWTVAGIGMAVAASWETAILGATAAVIVVFTLSVVARLADTYITSRRQQRLRVITGTDRDIVGKLLLGLAERGFETRGVTIEEDAKQAELTVSLTLRTRPGFRRQEVADWLAKQPGIVRLHWD
jgi:putative Mg2+ transporter-C (MgtC) family protein